MELSPFSTHVFNCNAPVVMTSKFNLDKKGNGQKEKFCPVLVPIKWMRNMVNVTMMRGFVTAKWFLKQNVKVVTSYPKHINHLLGEKMICSSFDIVARLYSIMTFFMGNSWSKLQEELCKRLGGKYSGADPGFGEKMRHENSRTQWNKYFFLNNE